MFHELTAEHKVQESDFFHNFLNTREYPPLRISCTQESAMLAPTDLKCSSLLIQVLRQESEDGMISMSIAVDAIIDATGIKEVGP
jgi:hypothetical protein